jgi:hypothetical protein
VELLIHIGYPKTGTTTIQEHFFLELHEKGLINYLGKSDLSNEFLNLSSLLKRKVVMSEAVDIKSFFNSLKEGMLNVVSDEDFPLSFFNIDGQKRLFRTHPIETINNLKKALSSSGFNVKVNILSTIRRQDSLIYSTFVQGYKAYFSKEESIAGFDDYLAGGLKKRKDGYFLMYYFHEVMGAYASAFGHENVKICLFEDMMNDSASFSKDFCFFFPEYYDLLFDKLMIKENTKRKSSSGYYTHELSVVELIYRFTGSAFISPLKKVVKKSSVISTFYGFISLYAGKIKINKGMHVPFLNEETKAAILKEFDSDNARLCSSFSINVEKFKKYGYIKNSFVMQKIVSAEKYNE